MIRQVAPVVLFVLIVASMISVGFIPTTIEISGQVVDNDGGPLGEIYIVVMSDEVRVESTGTDSYGRYSVVLHETGQFRVWAHREGYWEQYKDIEIPTNQKKVKESVDFQLAHNVPAGNIPLVAMFWSVNSSHTSISYGYYVYGEIYTAVHKPNSSAENGSHVHYDGGESPGSRGGGTGYLGQRSFVLSRPAFVGGFYSTTPGEFDQYSLGSGYEGGYLNSTMNEYLSPDDFEGGSTFTIEPNQSRQVKMQAHGNYTLPEVFSLHFSVNILGKNASGSFICTMLDTENGWHSSWIDLRNLDETSHTYKAYFEGGHILHIWEI